MIPLLLIAGVLAQDLDCSDGRASWLAELEAQGSRRAYGCLAADPEVVPTLLQTAGTAAQPERFTRALALWRLHRLDEPVTAEEARAYGPSDRRLLLDAIKAHRGRASAAPEHVAVLETLPWYKPVDRYTDARLTAMDHQNLAILQRPPEPQPPPEPEPDLSPPPHRAEGRCGCGLGPGVGWLPSLLLLVGPLMRRRSARAASGAPRRVVRPPQD